MNAAVVAAVVGVVVVVRLWRRHRHRPTTDAGIRFRSGPFTSDVGLVAVREVRERVRGRIFRVGTVLMLAVVAAAIIIPVVRGGSSSPGSETVGVVGAVDGPLQGAVADSAKSIGITARLVPEADPRAAEADLRSGHLALVIINGQTLLVKKGISDTDTSTDAAFVHALSTNLGVAAAFKAAGLSEVQSSQIAHARAIPVSSLEPGTTTSSNHAAQGTSVVGLVLVFLMLTQYNTWTLIGVMEEKSSRVVEVLLAAVRPAQLLTGKVLGIGLVAFAQAAVIVGFALGLAKAVGSDVLNGTAPLVLVSTLVWLLLGYAFYCWVYAAAGSLTERQDQVQTMAFPLSLPLVFGYITALSATTAQHASTLVHVLAYLPPTAPFAMPVLVGLHAATWWQFVISAAVSVVATIGMARFAVSIYRRAILRTGRVQLRDLRARTTAAANP